MSAVKQRRQVAAVKREILVRYLVAAPLGLLIGLIVTATAVQPLEQLRGFLFDLRTVIWPMSIVAKRPAVLLALIVVAVMSAFPRTRSLPVALLIAACIAIAHPYLRHGTVTLSGVFNTLSMALIGAATISAVVPHLEARLKNSDKPMRELIRIVIGIPVGFLAAAAIPVMPLALMTMGFGGAVAVKILHFASFVAVVAILIAELRSIRSAAYFAAAGAGTAVTGTFIRWSGSVEPGAIAQAAIQMGIGGAIAGGIYWSLLGRRSGMAPVDK